MPGATLRVRVSPKSGRDEIVGWRDRELVLRVTAAPEAGKANAAVCRLIAQALGIPKSAVSVRRGAGARHKTLMVDVEPARLSEVLGAPDSGSGADDLAD